MATVIITNSAHVDEVSAVVVEGLYVGALSLALGEGVVVEKKLRGARFDDEGLPIPETTGDEDDWQ
jgi:hypothetical protein